MNKISMRLGANHWLILVMLAAYLSRVAYKTASMPGIGRASVKQK